MLRFPVGARRATLTTLSLLALAAPSAAFAHGTAADATSDHMADDAVLMEPAEEEAMARETRAATADDARAAAAAVPGSRGDIGEWGPLMPWEVVGVHAALMTDGKVLVYDSINDEPTEANAIHTTTRAMVFDPATGRQVRNDVGGFNIFCSGLGHLMDGTVFLAGGNKNRYFEGLKETHTFRNGLWALGKSMATERWYPTVTAMPNGEMLITAGQPRIERDVSSSQGIPDTPDVRTVSGDIRQLPGATRDADVKREEYPWTTVAPNGEAFISGPEPEMRSIDTSGSGRLRDRGPRDGTLRQYGSYAAYDIGKVLISGGVRPATSSAVTVDVNADTPRVNTTGSMHRERRQHNLTVLADGSVLATGGFSGWEEQVNLPTAHYEAELWNPTTGQWKLMAAARQARMYHSIALLLPDGRVLSAGGGICARCKETGYLAKDAQIYSPPYLFKDDGTPAARPTISYAPDTVAYGAPLEITTPQAGSIRKAALIRLGAVTHSVDMGQQHVPLQFSASGDTVTATGPRNANVAPPGPYMLVVTDAAGVPSVAKMVTVGLGGAPTVTLTKPAAGETFTGTVSLAATASASGTSVAKVEFFAGAAKLGEDTTAPYSYDWTGAPAGTHAVSARVTDARGAARRTAPTTVTVTPATPPIDPGTRGGPDPLPPVQPPVAPPTPPQPPVVAPPTEPPTVVPDPRAKVILPSSVTIRGKTVPVKVSCARACRGTLRIETLSGSLRGRVAFRLTGAGTKTLRVPVSAATRSLARRKPQRLRARMVVQAEGKQFTARRTFTLRVR